METAVFRPNEHGCRHSMKALSYISNKEKRAVWLRAFHIWQQRPHEVAPLSNEQHQCPTCGTVYQGNFCPRCGQSARVGRFSFQKALLLFLDVWGVGNRGMFRCIRDLMLRPGFMIRDYLRGMQSAYFPPFKMFFLLTALSLLVQHGFNLSMAEQEASDRNVTVTVKSANGEQKVLDSDANKQESAMYYYGMRFAKLMSSLKEKSPALFALTSLVMFSLPLFFFLRNSPAIPDLRFSEFIVALVYTSNAYSIYSIIGRLLHSSILDLLSLLIIFVALKQFSGYSKRRVLGYMILTAFISIAIIAALALLAIGITYMMVETK